VVGFGWLMAAASIPSNRERNRARGGAVEVRGEVDGLRDGSGSAPPACFARVREGRRRGETGFGW